MSMLEMLNFFKGLVLDELRKMFNSLIIKKANSENVSTPKVEVLNVKFALKLQIVDL